MICPRCAYEKSVVVGTVKGLQNERYRKCPKCGYTWQTIEVIKYDFYPKAYLKSLFEVEEKKDDNE